MMRRTPGRSPSLVCDLQREYPESRRPDPAGDQLINDNGLQASHGKTILRGFFFSYDRLIVVADLGYILSGAMRRQTGRFGYSTGGQLNGL